MNKEELVRITNIARNNLERVEFQSKKEQDIRLKISNLIEDKEFNEFLSRCALYYASDGKSICIINFNKYNRQNIFDIILESKDYDGSNILKSGLENKYKGIIFDVDITYDRVEIKLVWDP